MILTGSEKLKIFFLKNESEAVKIAVKNLSSDFSDVLGCEVETVCTDNDERSDFVGKRIMVKTIKQENGRRECYTISSENDVISIIGSDRRGTVYGIYTLSEMLGVSPWYFFADVPKKKRDSFELVNGCKITDYPEIEYRGIFINDEEELEHWVRNYMHEDTIGVKTYEKVFELLLRLKLNYIWPAMHVNSFNMKRENGELADRMGIVVGTSHCDMLMRSNNREWIPWINKKGYTDATYDYSVPGRNREILNEYWRESVEQNKDFEVSYTLGMRGIHDSGFNVKSFADLKDAELLKAKIGLLEEVIDVQQSILKETLNKDTMKIFVPYKEVLELYDNGLKVSEDLTLIWVNDNYGYVRRYPDEHEKKRKGGNGLYYHNSYWSPPGNSYLFINSIPLAHTKNELKKAYKEGIRKLWITNFGCIKPLEEQMAFFADYAWEAGREDNTARKEGISEAELKTADVDIWVETWLKKTFTGENFSETAKLLNSFDSLTNVRKIEHLTNDVFPFETYGDEGAYRLSRYERIFDAVNAVYKSLPENEKDAFFELVGMKVHAAYFSNAMFYYADRSNLCMKQGKTSAAGKYTVLSLKYDRLRRKMLYYYNRVMADGKWNGILTPEDFPPPRTAMFPPCMPPLFEEKKGLVVTSWGGTSTISFSNRKTKWIEIANKGNGGLKYEITAPEWVNLSKSSGTVYEEERIDVSVISECDCSGVITITAHETGESRKVLVTYKEAVAGFDDNRLIIPSEAYVYKSANAVLIPGLGRDHGRLMQLNNDGATVSYRFEVPESDEYTIVIHRFPSLNSVGRIRCTVSVDAKKQIIYETEASDEHRGTWKYNVQNNVDDNVKIKVPLDKGIHMITLGGIDRYFAFSRIVIYRGTPERDNLAVYCYENHLPREFDMDSFADDFYGNIVLEPRRKVIATIGCGTNPNTDYDTYLNGAEETDIEKWPEKSLETISNILETGEHIFSYKEGCVKIDAAAALINSEFASISGENSNLVTYCNSPSYGGTGLALYIREKGERFSGSEAPILKYKFEKNEASNMILWMNLFMWGNDQSVFEITLDGKHYTKEDWLKPGIWAFSAENTWRCVPVMEVFLAEGTHELEIHLLSRGMRVDEILLKDSEVQ